MKILMLICICYSVCYGIPGVKDIIEGHCVDRPTTFIDGVVLSKQGDIYLFSYDIVSRVEKFGRNGVPLLTSDSPKYIKDLWSLSPTQFQTAFRYNNYNYLLKDKKLWKFDPTRQSAPFYVDYFKEFAFFSQNISGSEYEIVSIVTEPIIDSNDTAFYIFYTEPFFRRFLEIVVYKGNSTEQLTKPNRVVINKSVSDLIFSENLVYEHWKLENNLIALKSIWFRKNVFQNIIYQQNYQFISLNNTQSNTRIQSIGYNQVWLGCPQPMCLDSTMDTCFKINEIFIAIRGKFYWNITSNNPPYTRKANLITDLWPGLPQNLDASYFNDNNNEFYFFKDELYYNFKGKQRIQNTIDSRFPGVPTHVDAVFYINRTQSLYFFKGDKYFLFALHDNKLTRKGSITEFPGLPNYIDSAYATEHHIFIFKSWYYYQFDVKSFTDHSKKGARYETFESKTTFLLFNCPRTLYLLSDFYQMDTYLEHFRYLKPVEAKHDKMLKDKFEYQSALSTDSHVSVTDGSQSSDNNTFNSTDIGAEDGSDENNKGSKSYLFMVIILFVILLAIAAIIGMAIFVRRIRKSPENSENDIDYDATDANDNNNNNAVTEEAAAKVAKPAENKTNNDKNKLKKLQQTGYYMDSPPRKQNTQKTQMTQRTGYSLGVRPKKADNNQFGQFDKEIELKINEIVDEEEDDLVDDDDSLKVKRKSTEPFLVTKQNK